MTAIGHPRPCGAVAIRARFGLGISFGLAAAFALWRARQFVLWRRRRGAEVSA